MRAVILAVVLAGVAAGAAAAQPKLKDLGDEVGIGRNLTGEDCRLRLLNRSEVNNLAVDRFGLYCGTWRQASATLQTFRAGDRFKPEAIIVEGNWARAYQTRLADCDDPKQGSALGAAPAAFRTCKSRDVGVPVVALATRYEGAAWLVEAMPTNLAVVERAIAVMAGKEPPADAREGSRTAMIRSWETIYKTDAAKIAASDPQAIMDLRELGLSQLYARRLGDAEKTVRQLIDVWGRALGADHPAIGRAYADLGMIYNVMGRLDDSERVLNEAGKRARLSPVADDEGLVLTYRGNRALRMGDKDAALKFIRQGLQVRKDRRLNARALGHSVLFELEVLNALGRYDESVATGEEAVRLLIPGFGNTHPLLANAYITIGLAKVRLGRPADARSDYEKAVRIRERLFGDGSRLGSALLELVRAVREEQGPSAAFPLIERAVAVTMKEPPGGLTISGEQAGMAISTLLKVTAAEPGRAARAQELAALVAQLPNAGVTSDAINKMAARLEAGDAATGSAARALQDATRRETDLRTRLARAQGIDQGEDSEKRDPARERELQSELDQAVADVAAAEQRLQAGFPRYASLVNIRPVPAAELGKLLKADEALVQILPTSWGTFTLVVRSGGKLSVSQSALKRDQVEELVARLRAGLDWQGGGERPFDLALAHQLYRDLLGGAEAALAGARRITVVQSGPLQSLPLAVLLTAPPQGGGYAGQPWLGRRHAIGLATSFRSFAELRRAGGKPAAPEPFLGIGDPAFGAGAASGDGRGLADVVGACRMDDGIDPAVLRKLPRLPETADEVAAVGRALGAPDAALLTGAKASEQAVAGMDLARYRVLHFATHGLLSGEARCLNEPALALAPPAKRSGRVDGLLDASEIARLKLNADWVVLSACNTAGPDGSLTGETLSGLARAFFYAGARGVMASHWPVFSKPTVALITRTFESYSANMDGGKAAALQQGMLGLMDQPQTAHPAVWAPFVVVGDG